MSTGPTPGPGPGAAASASVLVVDGADATRTVFTDWLHRAGHDVHEARSGAEAFEVLARSRVDLVLLDVDLPDMSGIEVCEQIKSSRATSGIPVLHISATPTEAGDRTEALNRGADGYLIEPVQREEFLATVTALLRYHEARRTAEHLASSLERLHQGTLLMNAAATVAELMQAACTSLVTVFGAPAAVLAIRDDVGRLATATPSSAEPFVRPYPAAAILELARGLHVDERVAPHSVAGILGPAAGVSAAPITTPRGELMGVILLHRDEESAADPLMLDHFAQAFAVAFENQRLYAIEHNIALTLQRAMLPSALPTVAELDIAVSYHAASDAAEVGGDFYDVLRLDERRVLVAVGDVVGHSLHAATIMAELRHSLRAYAGVGLGPVEILERLGRSLAEGNRGLTATLCLAEIDLATQTVRVTNAGQVPPVLRTLDGATTIDEHGPLLGLNGVAPAPTTERPFPPGSVLVLATDGLIERRTEDLRAGIARFLASVAAHEGDMEQLCARLLQDVTGPVALDDIAIVAVKAV